MFVIAIALIPNQPLPPPKLLQTEPKFNKRKGANKNISNRIEGANKVAIAVNSDTLKI